MTVKGKSDLQVVTEVLVNLVHAVSLLRRELRQARTEAKHPELPVSDYPE